MAPAAVVRCHRLAASRAGGHTCACQTPAAPLLAPATPQVACRRPSPQAHAQGSGLRSDADVLDSCCATCCGCEVGGCGCGCGCGSRGRGRRPAAAGRGSGYDSESGCHHDAGCGWHLVRHETTTRVCLHAATGTSSVPAAGRGAGYGSCGRGRVSRHADCGCCAARYGPGGHENSRVHRGCRHCHHAPCPAHPTTPRRLWRRSSAARCPSECWHVARRQMVPVRGWVLVLVQMPWWHAPFWGHRHQTSCCCYGSGGCGDGRCCAHPCRLPVPVWRAWPPSFPSSCVSSPSWRPSLPSLRPSACSSALHEPVRCHEELASVARASAAHAAQHVPPAEWPACAWGSPGSSHARPSRAV